MITTLCVRVCVCEMCICMLCGTISQMAVSPWVNDITESLFEFLIAGKIEGVGRSCPDCRCVQPPHWPPNSLCGNNSVQGIHHILVAGCGLRLEALHSRLAKRKHTENQHCVTFLKECDTITEMDAQSAIHLAGGHCDCREAGGWQKKGEMSCWTLCVGRVDVDVKFNRRKHGAASSKVTRGHQLTSSSLLFPLTLKIRFRIYHTLTYYLKNKSKGNSAVGYFVI